MQKQIVDAALIFAKLCFAVYLILSVTPLVLAAQKYEEQKAKDDGNRRLVPVPFNVVDTVKAFAALAEGLVKAGPALWALIGSMFFLVLAGFAAGLFTTP